MKRGLFTIVFLIAAVNGTVRGDHSFWSPETIFEFADFLERTGDNFRAITEYRRLVFHWPEHPLAMESRYRIGRSYIKTGDPEKAIETFLQGLRRSVDQSEENRIRYALAYAYYSASRWSLADQQLSLIEPDHEDPGPYSSVFYSRLWCRLKPGSMDSALRFWSEAKMLNNCTPSHSRIQDALNEMASQPMKNPRLAGSLSAAIPGLGQVYAGRWRDGLVSFLVNALFIGAMAVAIDRNHDETACVLGFFELGFYSANIYNAVNDAHKTNRFIRAQHMSQFEQIFGSPFRNIESSSNP